MSEQHGYKVILSLDGISALNMAINIRKRELEDSLKKVTSDQWRKTMETELAALDQSQDALKDSEFVTI